MRREKYDVGLVTGRTSNRITQLGQEIAAAGAPSTEITQN